MISEVIFKVGQKPATSSYPATSANLPEDFRGQISFEAVRCIGCKLCMRDCPAEAIIITKIGDGLFECEFDLSKCIYCGQCVDTCPKDALSCTPHFELAAIDKSTLKVLFHAKAKPPKEEVKKETPPEDSDKKEN